MPLLSEFDVISVIKVLKESFTMAIELIERKNLVFVLKLLDLIVLNQI